MMSYFTQLRSNGKVFNMRNDVLIKIHAMVPRSHAYDAISEKSKFMKNSPTLPKRAKNRSNYLPKTQGLTKKLE